MSWLTLNINVRYSQFLKTKLCNLSKFAGSIIEAEIKMMLLLNPNLNKTHSYEMPILIIKRDYLNVHLDLTGWQNRLPDIFKNTNEIKMLDLRRHALFPNVMINPLQFIKISAQIKINFNKSS